MSHTTIAKGKKKKKKKEIQKSKAFLHTYQPSIYTKLLQAL